MRRRRRRQCSAVLLLIFIAVLIALMWTKESTNVLENEINAILDVTLDITDIRDWHVLAPNWSVNPVQYLCSALVGKHILFIGPQTTYYLHNLWLDALERHQNASLPCLGPEFCTFHHICRSPNATTVFHDRTIKYPHERELRATNSSILRYVLSDTLHAATNPKDPAYTSPIIDSYTHVRVRNAYWLGHAKRADLIIANRGPFPAPAWTYKISTPKGNWSFADELYLDSSTAYLKGGERSFATRVVNAALHVTLDKFLPSTLDSLDILQAHSSRQRLLVWHASWYLHPYCHVLGKTRALHIQDPFNDFLTTDPWSLYYNAQVYMQNHVMQKIIPYYDGVFYAQWIPDGQVEDYRLLGERKQAADCLLYAPTTVLGRTMEERFLNGLAHLVYNSAA